MTTQKFELIPDPHRTDGSFTKNLGTPWEVDRVVKRFGESPALGRNGHDWWFKNSAGLVFSLGCRHGVFVTGASRGASVMDVREFEDWLRHELAQGG